MSLFVCEECGVIENTAKGVFWTRLGRDDKRARCSQCAFGEWHGVFPRQIYDGTQGVDWVNGEWIKGRAV